MKSQSLTHAWHIVSIQFVEIINVFPRLDFSEGRLRETIKRTCWGSHSATSKCPHLSVKLSLGAVKESKSKSSLHALLLERTCSSHENHLKFIKTST